MVFITGKYKDKVSTMVIQLQGIFRNLKMCGAGLTLTMRKTTGDGVCCRNKMDLAFNQGLPGKHQSRFNRNLHFFFSCGAKEPQV